MEVNPFEDVVSAGRVKAEVTDICRGDFVVCSFLEDGASVVDLTGVVAAGVEVWASATSDVEDEEVCGLVVDVLGISSKSAKRFTFTFYSISINQKPTMYFLIFTNVLRNSH